MNKLIIPTEQQEQIILVKWLNINKIHYFAPINENNQSFTNRKVALIQEQKNKEMGKRKGTSDLVVMLKNKILFIELKRRPRILKSGKLSVSHTSTSDSQKKFINDVNSYKYATGRVCYGFEDAVKFIKENM